MAIAIGIVSLTPAGLAGVVFADKQPEVVDDGLVDRVDQVGRVDARRGWDDRRGVGGVDAVQACGAATAGRWTHS